MWAVVPRFRPIAFSALALSTRLVLRRCFSLFAVPMLDRMKIDDVVGAIPVHLMAGIWGTLAVPLTNPEASLSTQLISVAVVGVFVCVASSIVWLILNATMGLRVDEEAEINGLDMAELGMEAYPEFARG
mgnify:CR=1 FL=1